MTSTVTGRTRADHGATGSNSDSHRHCQTLGDPDSGEWHTTHQGHFLPGSGIPVDQLAAMVIEFLNTAELPERVQWRDLNRHGRQAHRAVS